MASFFGEIGELSSRAVDDEEVESFPDYAVEVQLESRVQGKKECKLIIFCVGQLAATFAECFFSHDYKNPLFEITYFDRNRLHSKQSKAATGYFIEPGVIVCEILSSVPREINSEVCREILNHVTATEAIVLTSQPRSAYKTEETLSSESSFLISIPTSAYTRSNPVARIAAPNFLGGFPAAVIAEFEILKKPALCIVNYVNLDRLDSDNIQAYAEVFCGMDIKLVPVNNAMSALSECIKKRYGLESNLYT